MKKYFLQFRSNAAKNKAQDELQKFAYTWQNTLCDYAGLVRIVYANKLKAAELNAKYPRCKPMHVHFKLKEDGAYYNTFNASVEHEETQIFICSVDAVWREEFE